MIQGQMTLFDFLNPADAEEPQEPKKKINFSCFACWRTNKHGVKFGECAYPENKGDCESCDAHIAFYEKAEEYHKAGEKWNVSVAMAREFFEIKTVPEYTVKHYKGVKG